MGRTLKRRRFQAKTDYRARLELLKSGCNRLVIRKTNRLVIAQVVKSENAQDKILFGVSSKDLLSSVWPKDSTGSLKSLPACYLTGYLLAKKSNTKGKIVLDIGMHRHIPKSRIYAVVKGAIDAGMEVQVSEDVLPTLEEMSKNPKVGKLINLKEKLK